MPVSRDTVLLSSGDPLWTVWN